MGRSRLAVVMSGFPRRSETFALAELSALHARGQLAAIFSTKPGEDVVQPGSETLLPLVRPLPQADAAGQAAFAARLLAGRNVQGIHAYFAHHPARVAQQLARLIAVPFSFSVHARDARKIAAWELTERARQAACVIACNPDVAGEIRSAGRAVRLLPHGVDLRRFSARPWPAESPFRILAVGRLVEKKGFHILLDAIRRLPFPFLLRIVGDGPQKERLSAMVQRSGLCDRVTFCGALTHAELPGEYACAHALVAPSLVDSTGDRDGLPNVILEAMACARAVVASDVAAIATAVVQGLTGLLVPPGDAARLAEALEHLAQGRPQALLMGQRGHLRAAAKFELHRCAARFCDQLEAVYA